MRQRFLEGLEEAKRRDIDAEFKIIEPLSKDPGLDLREEALIHLKLATELLNEAGQTIKREDAVLS